MIACPNCHESKYLKTSITGGQGTGRPERWKNECKKCGCKWTGGSDDAPSDIERPVAVEHPSPEGPAAARQPTDSRGRGRGAVHTK